MLFTVNNVDACASMLAAKLLAARLRVDSVAALCVILSSLHHFFLRLCSLLSVCQLLKQSSQLALVLLLKLSNSLLLMNTTGHHLWVMHCVLRRCTARQMLMSGPACKHLHVLPCLSLLY